MATSNSLTCSETLELKRPNCDECRGKFVLHHHDLKSIASCPHCAAIMGPEEIERIKALLLEAALLDGGQE